MYVQGSSLTILFFVLKFQKNPIIFINGTLSIVIHFIFKSSNAILMVGFVLTNFLMQMLKYLIHAKYMQKIHHLQDQWKKR